MLDINIALTQGRLKRPMGMMGMSADITLQKRIRGWMMFDWATQPFYTLGVTFIFGPYFAAVAVAHYLGLGQEEGLAKANAQSIWFWGQAISGVFIAISAPLVGAYADSTGRRMPWLIGSAVIYVIGSWLLWYTMPDGSTLILSLIIFNVAFVAAEYALIFTNSILPSLGDKEEVGRISGNGAALGYWGGVLSLFIMLFFFVGGEDTGKTFLVGLDPIFGLDASQKEGTRAVGPFIAIWFVIFMIPYWLYVRENDKPNRSGGMNQALADIQRSLSGAFARKSLFNFLLSSMFYRDALNALYAAGGIYATLVLEWSTIQLGVFGIVGAITAAIATQISGLFDRANGPRPVIRFNIFVLIGVSLVIIGMSRTSFYGIELAEGSGLPDIIMYICGAAIGGAGGGLYAASRSMMVRHTNPDRPTEGFGLFALSGKATAFLAPTLIAMFTAISGNVQVGFVPVIILFLIGLFLLRKVQPDGDLEAWSNSSIPAP